MSLWLLSNGIKELSTTGPSSDQTTAAGLSSAGSKQRKGRGRRGEKNSASPVDTEVVSGGGGSGGKM
jgi:hypothetical protein